MEVFFVEGSELAERNIPGDVLAQIHAWSEATVTRIDLAKEFGRGKGVKIAHLDAVDWLFYGGSEPGSFSFVLDIASMAMGREMDLEAAREALLRNRDMRAAVQRFETLLQGGKCPSNLIQSVRRRPLLARAA